jgi:hypothetical protein
MLILHSADAVGDAAQYGAGMRRLAPMFAAGWARLVALRPPLTDVLLAAGVLVVAQVETWMTSSFQPKPPLALLAVLMTVPLRGGGGRRLLPWWWALPGRCWAPAGRSSTRSTPYAPT